MSPSLSSLAGSRPGPAPLASRAYEHLKARILEGDLAPGDRLAVSALAQALACSRVPVMEALKRLQGDGLVDIVPQVGCQVAEPKADDVEDFFAAFAAVEGTVARLAAQRRTAADLAAFGQTLARIGRALQDAGGPQDRDPRYRRLNRDFHGAIHAMARAPAAGTIAAALWDRSDFLIKAAFGSLYFSPRVRAAHAAVVDAIQHGDADAAQVAMTQHLQKVGAAVAARLRAMETDGGGERPGAVPASPSSRTPSTAP
ncbi:MAG: GntR family transcriptional regulator [Immundisolibacter sp.]